MESPENTKRAKQFERVYTALLVGTCGGPAPRLDYLYIAVVVGEGCDCCDTYRYRGILRSPIPT